MTILIVDNFDSFTYNLVQLLGEIYNDKIFVFRNDEISISEIRRINPDFIVISPGPGNPINSSDFGICRQILIELSPYVPTLGVCLGHQGIGLIFGGSIIQAGNIKHGKTSIIDHTGTDIFQNVPNPFIGGRYHSLAIEKSTLPVELEILAMSDDNEIMAVKHRDLPIYGLQFHPESILTENGKLLLQNFLGVN